jgi:cell shape-determining protein MreC
MIFYNVYYKVKKALQDQLNKPKNSKKLYPENKKLKAKVEAQVLQRIKEL